MGEDCASCGGGSRTHRRGTRLLVGRNTPPHFLVVHPSRPPLVSSMEMGGGEWMRRGMNMPACHRRVRLACALCACLFLVSATAERVTPQWTPLPQGEVGDAKCNVEEVESANEHQLHEILNELTNTTFFRLFQVDLTRKCKFWNKQEVRRRTEEARRGATPSTPRPRILSRSSPPTTHTHTRQMKRHSAGHGTALRRRRECSCVVHSLTRPILTAIPVDPSKSPACAFIGSLNVFFCFPHGMVAGCVGGGPLLQRAGGGPNRCERIRRFWFPGRPRRRCRRSAGVRGSVDGVGRDPSYDVFARPGEQGPERDEVVPFDDPGGQDDQPAGDSGHPRHGG